MARALAPSLRHSALRLSFSRRLRVGREGHREGASLVDLRADGDIAAVEADDLAGQRQSQAGAGDVVDPLVLGPVELLEDELGLLGADPDAGIVDLDLEPVGPDLDLDLDLAA